MAVAAVVSRNRQKSEVTSSVTNIGLSQAMMLNKTKDPHQRKNSFITSQVLASGPGGNSVVIGRRRASGVRFGAGDDPTKALVEDAERGGGAEYQGEFLGEENPTELTTRDLVFFLWDGFPHPKYAAIYPRMWTASDILGKVNFFFVIASCLSFATETLPEFYRRNLLPFVIIEWICIVFFTIDLLTRAILVRSKLSFVKSPQNWIDLISIIPFYIALFTDSDDGGGASGLIMFRTLRLMRILRVLKLSKHNIGLEAVLEALTESSEAISLLGFLLVIALVLFSSAMFFAEQTVSYYDEARGLWYRSDGRVSPFQSIFHSMWWCIVTITTVGYGDAVPLSALGKILAGFTMICGVFVIAFPTVILSTNFQEIHQAKVEAQRQLLEELEMQREQAILDAEQRKKEEEESAREKEGVSKGEEGVALVTATGGNDGVAKDSNETESNQHTEEEMMALVERPTSFVYKFSPPGSAEMQITATTANRFSEQEIQAQQEYHAIVVVNTELAVFEPTLHLQCTKENHLHARVEQFGEQTIVTVQLLLESLEALTAAEEALIENRPGEELTLVCRPIAKITCELATNHPSLQGIRLMTTTFTEPVGAVPLSMVVPTPTMVKPLLANISSVTFTINVDYDCPAALDEPMIHYGGVVLGTTSYDEEEEDAEQAVLVERTIGRRSIQY